MVFGCWQSRGTENNVGLMHRYTFSSVLRSHSQQETADEPLCGPFPLPVSSWLRRDRRMIFGETHTHFNGRMNRLTEKRRYILVLSEESICHYKCQRFAVAMTFCRLHSLSCHSFMALCSPEKAFYIPKCDGAEARITILSFANNAVILHSHSIINRFWYRQRRPRLINTRCHKSTLVSRCHSEVAANGLRGNAVVCSASLLDFVLGWVRIHLGLNAGTRPLAGTSREEKLKRTFKSELKRV